MLLERLRPCVGFHFFAGTNETEGHRAVLIIQIDFLDYRAREQLPQPM